MDEKEYLEKKEKHNRIVGLVTGVWLITALPLLMTTDVSFIFLVIVVLLLPIALIIIRKRDNLSKKDDMLWISGDGMDRLILGMMRMGIAFVFIGYLEGVMIAYLYLQRGIVDEQSFRMYSVLGVLVPISYTAMVFMAPMQRKNIFGNWRIMKTSAVNIDEMRDIVKKALDNLNIEYEVPEKKGPVALPWRILVGGEMKISVEKEGLGRTIIIISKIPEHMVDVERKIEREISGLIQSG